MPDETPNTVVTKPVQLARRLGWFDATMIVMGGIIGSGIFINPYVVATQVHTPVLILGVWLLGGVTALIGAFIYAELATLLPKVGGQYAYMREAFHPAVAFVFGWALLLVTQTGGMAAVAITFARYFIELTQIPMPDWLIASLALAFLTIINCLGVRTGSTFQNIMMILKILAIAMLVIIGFTAAHVSNVSLTPAIDRPVSFGLLAAIGAAMIPVLFAYGGWQTSNFIAGEIHEPKKNLPRGLLLGVTGVIILYLAVNILSIAVLGVHDLAHTSTPATEVMRRAIGEQGVRLISIGITISTLGFLSQGMLTAPRVYFAMAQDGLFFKQVAHIHPRTKAPVTAIVIQGILAIVIALSGKYEQILNFVVSTDFIFFGLTATTIFVFRKRDRMNGLHHDSFKTPLHPFTTSFFIIVCWLVVLSTIVTYPANSLIGVGIMLTGIPVYFFWRKKRP
ncbi:MAG TPA: amino acid permease [Bacteroidota bacterium]|nr:amino acid permease [Bacteroidota bacterium]